MATASDWVAGTRSILLSGLQAERNSLISGYTAGSGTLAFSGVLGGIVPGVRLSLGLNTFYVRAVNNTGLTATVFGGQEGTTDANANSGDIVLVSPRFTDFEILSALNNELASLSAPDAGLFQVRTATITFANSAIGYELTALSDLIDIIEVRYQNSGTFKDWPLLHQNEWRLNRNADTTTFPSGTALELYDAAVGGLSVRLLYRSGFTAMATLATDVTTTGLPTTAYDIPAWGAALRLVAGREVKRTQLEAQPDARRTADVPAGATLASMRGIAAMRAERIQAERARLGAQFPSRRW